jgi:hypothetical protein
LESSEGYVATTGINQIYENLEGEKALTKEFLERYMNEKVEKELVDFKKEINQKFIASEMNATYVFLRTKPIKKIQKVFMREPNSIQPSYTFNEKILMKNMNKYEKAIKGENDLTRDQNDQSEEPSTFDYKLPSNLTQQKQANTLYSEDYDISASKIYKGSGIL